MPEKELSAPAPTRRYGTTALALLAVLLVVGLAIVAPRWMSGWAIGSGLSSGAGAERRAVPAPAVDETPNAAGDEVAVLAGGCFWGVQGVFQHVDGVTNAVSGYAGGSARTASYDTVSTGRTGHAESVEITFDPTVISYGRLLQIYFSVAHDPTELDRQGPDVGTQYRSTIFPTSAQQERIARAYIQELDQAEVFGSAIVTTIQPGTTFYRAENHHQDFMARNPRYPYIVANDQPKVELLSRLFADRYRSEPALVHKR